MPLFTVVLEVGDDAKEAFSYVWHSRALIDLHRSVFFLKP